MEQDVNRELIQQAIDALMECDRDGDYPLIEQLNAALAAPVAPAGDKPATSEPFTAEQIAAEAKARYTLQTSVQAFANGALWGALVQLKTAAPPDVPPGWVLVPVEPTEAMLRDTKGRPLVTDDEYYFQRQSTADEFARQLYRDMLAAAPKAPT